MALNFLSKHTIIIGVVAILASFIYVTGMLKELFNIVPIKDEFYSEDSFYSMVILYSVILGISLLSLVFSCLMIYGVFKKRHMLIAPWLIWMLLLSFVLASILIYQFLIPYPRGCTQILFIFLVIGFEFIVIHPVWQLVTELRRAGNAASMKGHDANCIKRI